MAKVITARKPDHCRECRATITPGTQINYGGPGAVSCVTCRPLQATRRGVRGGVDATGARCEDAPCCGCC